MLLIAASLCALVSYSEEMPDMGYGYVLQWGTNGNHWDMKYQYSEQDQYVEPSLDAKGRLWTEQGYDDSDWPTLTGPMASPTKHHATCVYLWNGQYNCFNLRRTFNIEKNESYTYKFCVCHDDDFILYINGQEVVNEEGWMDYWFQYSTHEIPADVLVDGENTIAIFIKQNWGSAYLDYALYYEMAGTSALSNKLNELNIVYNDIATVQGALNDSINTKAAKIEAMLGHGSLQDEIKDGYTQEIATLKLEAEQLVADFAATNSAAIQELVSKVSACENGSSEYAEADLISEMEAYRVGLYSDEQCLVRLNEIFDRLKSIEAEVKELLPTSISSASEERIRRTRDQYLLNGMRVDNRHSGIIVSKGHKMVSK